VLVVVVVVVVGMVRLLLTELAEQVAVVMAQEEQPLALELSILVRAEVVVEVAPLLAARVGQAVLES